MNDTLSVRCRVSGSSNQCAETTFKTKEGAKSQRLEKENKIRKTYENSTTGIAKVICAGLVKSRNSVVYDCGITIEPIRAHEGHQTQLVNDSL